MEKDKKKREMAKRIMPLNMVGLLPVAADPQGSYTGVPLDPDEQPVQDADDL
jgi:hypothetical protein